MLTLAHAARLYGVDLIDYERPSSGLLVSSGAGTMMALMDEAPELRWCFDIDGLGESARLGDFLEMADRLADPIVVAGWFSITRPEPLQRAIAAMQRPPIVYAGHIRLGIPGELESLSELLEHLRRRREQPKSA